MRAISPFASTRPGPKLEKHPPHAAAWLDSAYGGSACSADRNPSRSNREAGILLGEKLVTVLCRLQPTVLSTDLSARHSSLGLLMRRASKAFMASASRAWANNGCW